MIEAVIANGKSLKTKVVFQPSRCLNIDMSADVTLGTQYFLVKVNGTEPVTLTVVYADDELEIETSFQPGWNPDVIKKIKADVLITNVQIGF